MSQLEAPEAPAERVEEPRQLQLALVYGEALTELPLDLARIRAAAELALAIECEEGVVDEIRRGPGFTLEDMPICTKMPGERSQAGIGGGEKALERHLVLRVG